MAFSRQEYWSGVPLPSSNLVDYYFLIIVGNCHKFAAAAAKSLQSCPTLCDPIDGSPPGYTIPGILQARTPEGVAISPTNAWKWKAKVKSLSCIRLFATPWTAAYQAPPSMGFSRQEYWSGVPCHKFILNHNRVLAIKTSNFQGNCYNVPNTKYFLL